MMERGRGQARNIDEYIAGFPQDVQGKLQAVRMTIRDAAPEAEETINYAIPTFKLYGNLVHVTVPKLVNFFRPLQKWETTTLPLRLFHVSLRQIAPFSP
jgi:uncharacterized protein YdhG (YjbR/CyaY superfamily)